MRCPYCGERVYDGLTRCGNCGATVGPDAGGPAPPVPYPARPYPYYPTAPAPQAMGWSPLKIIAVVIGVVALLVVLLLAISIFWIWATPYSGDFSSGGNMEVSLGLRVEKTSDGDWLISVISGRFSAEQVSLEVTDPSTRQKTVSKPLTLLGSSDPDAYFRDNNADGKIGAGDTVLLRHESAGIKAGYSVQFVVDEEVVGRIRELPP